jgi:hypothetical protein
MRHGGAAWQAAPRNGLNAVKSAFLCSTTFPASFIFKYHFASTPTSFPGQMACWVSLPFPICSSGHPSSKTRFFSLFFFFFLGSKVATGFS